MKFEYFIAKRILGAKGSEPQNKNLLLTKPIINIAKIAVALSSCIMIVAVAILFGFQQQIKDKVSGFAGHIVISKFTENQSLENSSFPADKVDIVAIKNIPEVSSIYQFATKAAIIKNKSEMEGVVLKGVGEEYNWDFFRSKLIDGSLPQITDTGKNDQILISQPIANKLNYKVGDALFMYFIQYPPRMRKFKICGIYKTGLEDYDKIFVLGDIKHIKKLNEWKPNETGGFEVILKNFEDMNTIAPIIQSQLPYDLYAQSIREKEPQIFDWLSLQDMNVQVILVLMILVAGINMITALLVLILENTSLIGLLKALGATNKSVQKVFSIQAMQLLGTGLFWGNLIALTFCFLQHNFHLIKLDESSYYVPYVPIKFEWFYFILVNLGTFLVCGLMLILPAGVIARISPIKAIKFS